jgi:hypothetical protein
MEIKRKINFFSFTLPNVERKMEEGELSSQILRDAEYQVYA